MTGHATKEKAPYELSLAEAVDTHTHQGERIMTSVQDATGLTAIPTPRGGAMAVKGELLLLNGAHYIHSKPGVTEWLIQTIATDSDYEKGRYNTLHGHMAPTHPVYDVEPGEHYSYTIDGRYVEYKFIHWVQYLGDAFIGRDRWARYIVVAKPERLS